MTVPPKTEMLGIYPANYHEARDLFRQAAQDLGAHLENHVVLSGAEYGGDLTIDVAVVASKILLGHWLYRLACTVSKDFLDLHYKQLICDRCNVRTLSIPKDN